MMFRQKKASIWWVCLALMVGCTTTEKALVVRPWKTPPKASWAGLVIPTRLPPIEAQGRMQLNLKRGSTISQIRWQAWPNGYQRLLVQARITGFLVLDARWNDTQLLVIDYANRQRTLTANTAQARQALLQLDVTPTQWYFLFTGRIPQAAFTRQQGRQQANTVIFPTSQGPPQTAQQRITLDDRGLPVQWLRFAFSQSALPAQPRLRVEYQRYQSHAMSQHTNLVLPRRVRVFVDNQPKPAMVLVLPQFSPTTPYPTPFFQAPISARNFAIIQP